MHKNYLYVDDDATMSPTAKRFHNNAGFSSLTVFPWPSELSTGSSWLISVVTTIVLFSSLEDLVLEIETAFFFGTDFLWLCILFWIRYVNVFSYFIYNGNFQRILSLPFNFNRLDIFFHDVAFSIPSLIILKCHFISYMCVYLLILYLGKHSKRRSNNYTKKKLPI